MQKKISIRDFSLVIALLLICAFFAFKTEGVFLSSRNISMLTIELSITAILALGMLLILLPQHIDLSVGSGVGLFGGIAAVLVIQYGWPAPLALLVPTVGAVLAWATFSRLIVFEKIPAFIVTLGGMLVFRGLHWLVINNSTVPVVPGGQQNLFSILTTYYLHPAAGFTLFGVVALTMVGVQVAGNRRRIQHGLAKADGEDQFLRLFVGLQILLLFVLVMNQYSGIPLPAVILGVTAVVIYLITQHTRFGRYLYAIGGNEEAAFVSGIPVNRVIIGAFAILGLIVALTGFLQTAYQGSSSTTVGNLMELDAIAACVIGGTSLRGGRGTVVGVLFGALIMACLLNGMTLMAVQPEMKFIIRGLVLGLAVWMDMRLAKPDPKALAY